MSVESLLQDVSSELKAVRAARERYAIKLSPDFNCFDYIEPNELRLSQILADLLAPSGSHAQAYRFLDEFLRKIGLDDWIGEPVASVKLEDRITGIDRDRRVDIRIRWQDGRELVIENKPWANNPQDQLLDYIKDLENRKPVDWHVVYLGGTSATPEENSLPAGKRDECVCQNKLTLTTYGDLIVPWLTECIGLCESGRFRWFLGEFKAYVLAKFKGERDMVEREQVVETALDPKNREAAFEIICAQNEIRKRSFDKLKKDLVGKIGYKWSLVWGINDGSKPNEYFLIKFYENSSYSLRFHYEKKNFDQFFIGIYTDTPPHNRPDITAIMKARSADLGLVWNSRDHCNKTNWQCYAYFSDEKLRDWSISTDPWKRIWDGSLAETLFELIEEVYKAFEEQRKLHLLQ